VAFAAFAAPVAALAAFAAAAPFAAAAAAAAAAVTGSARQATRGVVMRLWADAMSVKAPTSPSIAMPEVLTLSAAWPTVAAPMSAPRRARGCEGAEGPRTLGTKTWPTRRPVPKAMAPIRAVVRRGIILVA